VTVISGKTTTSAPALAAFWVQSRIACEFFSMSPTHVSICARATRMSAMATA
jgi:hypothetical protein